MNSIEFLKDKIKKKATLMQIGGFRPDNDLLASWFGRVNFCLPGEEWHTLIQSEIYWAPYNQHPAKPEYIFQIDSTEKGNWMWGDNGVGYFGRGTKEGHEDEWTIEWQCY